MRVTDKNIKRAHVTVAERNRKNTKSKSVTVYGMTRDEVIDHLKSLSQQRLNTPQPVAS